MCEVMKEGNWTIERDEDLTAPYAFMNNTWMSFEDSVSVSIKACINNFNKYCYKSQLKRFNTAGKIHIATRFSRGCSD